MIWWIIIAVCSIIIIATAALKIYARYKEKIYFGRILENRNKLDTKSKKTYLKWIDFNNSDYPILIFVIFGIILLILILCQWIAIGVYNSFVIRFEVLREQYNMMDNINPNLLTIYNIQELNQELATYQASYLYFGYWWTTIPETVMDILPIGA